MLTLNELVEWNMTNTEIKKFRKCCCKQSCCQNKEKQSQNDHTDMKFKLNS